MKNTAKRLATAALLIGFVGSAQAATNIYNDSTGTYTNYNANSPFASTFGALSQLDGVGTPAEPDVSMYDFRGLTAAVSPDAAYFFLEDFQDGQLDSPGLSTTIDANYFVRTLDGRNGSGSKTSTSSVAEDIATGKGGFRFGGTATRTWTFDSAALGGNLPTYFGFAYPEDFNGALDFADLVTAYDIDNNVIGTIDNTGGVTPSAVPFYGFQTDVGIAYVEIQMNSAGEIDHFQYGHFVPPPAGTVIIIK